MPPQPEIELMDQSHSDKPEGAPACAQNADAGAPSGGAGPERRFSAQRKLAAVTRLLRGEPLETLARELNVTVARLSAWRDRTLVAAEAAIRSASATGAMRSCSGSGPSSARSPWPTSCWSRRSPLSRAAALWAAGGRGDEPGRLPGHWSSLRPG